MAVIASATISLSRVDDGPTGERGTGILKITTAPSSYTTTTGGFTPTYRIALSTVKSQSGVSNVLVGDVLQYSYYQYKVGYVDSSYVYTADRTSIRGSTGAAGATGATGKGVSQIITQYYISTSATTQSGGSWKTTQDGWSASQYLWTRSAITWTDGTTTYTDPVLASTLNTLRSEIDQKVNEITLTVTGADGQKTSIKIDDGTIDLTGEVLAQRIAVATLMAQDLLATGSFQVSNDKYMLLQNDNGFILRTKEEYTFGDYTFPRISLESTSSSLKMSAMSSTGLGNEVVVSASGTSLGNATSSISGIGAANGILYINADSEIWLQVPYGAEAIKIGNNGKYLSELFAEKADKTQRFGDISMTLSAKGWYRVGKLKSGNNDYAGSGAFRIVVGTVYNNWNNGCAIVDAAFSYQSATLVQAVRDGHAVVSQVRLVRDSTSSAIYYLDIYYNVDVANHTSVTVLPLFGVAELNSEFVAAPDSTATASLTFS